MFLYLLGLAVGFCILIVAADYFIRGASALARNLGVSPLIIGLTIVGLGTSTPEMLVAATASWQGNTGLAIGNAIGSNIANIGLVLGVTALVSPIVVRSAILRREFPVLLLISSASYLLLIDGNLSFIDGLVLLGSLVVFLLWVVRCAQKSKKALADPLDVEFSAEIPKDTSTSKASFFCLFGLIGLVLSSKLLVWAAVHIAITFGVSDLVIGLTIVAIGTSLPELAASITSVLKKEPDLAVGNVVGSNIFNLLAVLSLPGLIQPGSIDSLAIYRDFPLMLLMTVLLFLLSFNFKNKAQLGRAKGFVLVFLFIAYLGKLYLDTIGFSA
ncbi:MAG: calcium/sodium antiporter [Cycloclasticus sp. symbiont of Poecilosclerida sp. M]|nr:MAG: calcium/sodium antiporter [Cycloclasticus sp. symbiont of Poecilosclerida sp. M]